VKFLVDANLPPRLCVWLRSQRHEAEHLFDRNLLTATDTQIWERGRLESLVIFSKDTDFYDRALRYGAPPQVVHVDEIGRSTAPFGWRSRRRDVATVTCAEGIHNVEASGLWLTLALGGHKIDHNSDQNPFGACYEDDATFRGKDQAQRIGGRGGTT
jgi:predicted nuclease of predicted toxin-antitoxin system